MRDAHGSTSFPTPCKPRKSQGQPCARAPPSTVPHPSSLSRARWQGSSLPEHPRGAGPQDTLPEGSRARFLFPRLRKSLQYIGQKTEARVGSLSFQGQIAQPLSLRPQALSLASTQILFLQGTDSSLLPQGQDPLSLWKLQPQEAGVTARQRVWWFRPLSHVHSHLPNQRRGGREEGDRGVASCKHLACHTWAQPVLAAEINQPLQRWRRLGSLNQSQPEALLGKFLMCKEGLRALSQVNICPSPPPHFVD